MREVPGSVNKGGIEADDRERHGWMMLKRGSDSDTGEGDS